MKIRIAARDSKLSRIQVDYVIKALEKEIGGVETEFVPVKTRADLFLNKPLYEIGKGVFEKEVNYEVLTGKADIAVHSMKDTTSVLSEELEIYAVLKRDPPYDIIIPAIDLFEIEKGKIIGTSSIRRSNYISYYRPDLEIRTLRGNVDTRISKLQQGLYDAIVLAEAGIKRLGLDITYERIDPLIITPAPNQGIIVVVGKKNNEELKKLFKRINDKDTYEEALAERSVVNVVGGGCHSPLGVLFNKVDNELHGIASYSDGKRKITVSIVRKNQNPIEVGKELGRLLIKGMKDEGIVFKT